MKLRKFLGKAVLPFADERHIAHYHSAEDLENQALALSNYAGAYSGYDGSGDPFLSYAGQAVGFGDAAKNAKPFVITLTNTANAARIVKFCPGLIKTAAGLIADGAFVDKNGASGVSGASGSAGSIALFNAFINQFPTLISGFKIASDNVAQMDQSLTISKESPFQYHSSKVISTGVYASEGNFNTKILSIPEAFFMDNQTVIEYTILPATSITFTLMVGVSLNIAKALRSKTTTAKTTLQNNAQFMG